MPSTPPAPDGVTSPQPLTAERVRDLLISSVAEHRDVALVRKRPTIYADRLAVEIVDTARREWRIYVLVEPRGRCGPM